MPDRIDCEEAEAEWKPFEPMAMGSEFVLADARTRLGPTAAMVDAIDVPRNGSSRVTKNLKEASRQVNKAAREIAMAVDEGQEMLPTIYGVLKCLYALHCLDINTPVVGVANAPTDRSIVAQRLEAIAILKDRKQMAAELLILLANVGPIFKNDENVQRKMSNVRSWAWSADMPGIVVYVDLETDPPKQSDLAFPE